MFGLDLKSVLVGAALGYIVMNFLLPALSRRGE